MKITLKTPTVAHIEGTTQEIQSLQSQFAYKNGKVEQAMLRMRDNQWFRRNNPTEWQQQYDDLKSQVHANAVMKIKDQWIMRPGSVPYIKDMDVQISNQIQYPDSRPMAWYQKPAFDPYYYQSLSVKTLLAEKHGHISLPTGAGKSLCLQLLTRELGLKTVIITPSQSIYSELMDQFTKHFGKAKVGGYGDGSKDIKKPITIAISKSISMLKEGTDAYEFFKNKQVLMVDEAHTFAAETLEDSCHGVLADVPYRFFVSATQVRNDGTQKLLDSIIGRCVYEMSIKEAMDQGFLCPLKFKVVKTFSPSTTRKKDPMETKRLHFLRNKNIADLAAKIANSSWKMKQESTLILVEELQQIQMLKDRLTVPFTYVHSASKKEAAEYGLESVNTQDEIEKFNNGEVRVIIGTKAIAIGVNMYPTHNVIAFNGSGSEVATKQAQMGRATRKLELSRYKDFHKPKPYSLIYDFQVEGQSILLNQLKKRISWYEETGETVQFVG